MCGSRSLGADKEGVALAGRAERNLQLFIFRTHDALSDLLVAQVSSLPPPVGLKLKPWLPGHPANRQHTLTQKIMVPDENKNENFTKWRCLRPPENRKIVGYSFGEEVKSAWGVKGTFLPAHGLSLQVPP